MNLTLFVKVLDMTLEASIIIIFVCLIRLLLKKAPKIFSYMLWAVVLFRLLTPFAFEMPSSLIQRSVSEAKIVEELATIDIAPSTDLETNINVSEKYSELILDTNITASNIANVKYETTKPSLLFVLNIIWLSGIAALLIYSVISLIKLRRKLVGAMPIDKNMYLADYIDSPFVIGIIRPKIYLPSTLSEKELTYIIAHEQHHIHRLDHIVKLIGFAALCIHWFNPLVWLSFILMGKDMEMSCDEAVIKKLDEDICRDYSASLLKLATGRRLIAGTPLAFGEGNTKSRIKNVLSWKKPALWVMIGATTICIGVSIVCLFTPAESDENISNKGSNIKEYTITEPYEYPIVPGTDEWNALDSLDARIEVCQVPPNILSNMKTNALVETVVTHPLAPYRFASSSTNNQFAFLQVYNYILGMQELLHRPDCIEELEAYIANLPQNDSNDEITMSRLVAEALLSDCKFAKEEEPYMVQGYIKSDEYIEGEIYKLVTYYAMSDGTWKTEDYVYKYRLELTGRIPNAAKDTTYIVLSNRINITFEETWKATGLSSNLDDYFDEKEAIIVAYW